MVDDFYEIRVAPRERGQAMIFTAVAMPVIAMILAVAIFGGKAYVMHQQLQSAADVAAIAGAQELPCAVADTTCISNAETVACNYAAKNGYASCTPGGSTAPMAAVPPSTCSPYDFMDYGNGWSNSSCKSAAQPSYYDFVEVQLRKNLLTVPVLNIPINLFAHAVARHGGANPRGYALIALNSSGISMTNSNQTVIEGAVYSNGNITGDGNNIACSGGWFAAGSVSGVSTSTGSVTYSPLGCGAASGTQLTPSNQPPIADPYAASVPPTSSVWSGSTCIECSQPGYWYDLNGQTWGQGGTPSGVSQAPPPGGPPPPPGGPPPPPGGPPPPPGGSRCTSRIEMFPGTYTSIPSGNIYCVYMNPGVYTFSAPVNPALAPTKEHQGILCVFGAPTCDSQDNKGQCDNAKFSPGSAAGNTYFYQCSPWGFWDSSSFGGTRPAGLPTAGPTWYNAATSSWTTVPMNGVTLYFPSNSQNLGLTTQSGASTLSLLAAPNPCPGTGSSFTSNSVQFPQGVASATYTYPAASLVSAHGLSASQTYSGGATPYSLVYMNDDITQLGECGLPYVEWPNAMPLPQHVNFLIYESGPMNNLFYGTDDVDWEGVFYDPAGTLSFTGKSGAEGASGAEGIPWLTGQAVVGNVNFYGSSSVQIAYLPCIAGQDQCVTGSSLQLVQ